MKTTARQRRRARRHRGAALLICLFVIFMVSSLVLNVLRTETLQLAAARNIEGYERALYLANAGVHHACAILDDPATSGDRGAFDVGAFPADGTYRYTITDYVTPAGVPVPNAVEVVATGAAGSVERSVTSLVNL